MWGDGAPQCEPITIFQRWMPDFHTDTDNFFSPLHRYFYKEKIQDDLEEGSYNNYFGCIRVFRSCRPLISTQDKSLKTIVTLGE